MFILMVYNAPFTYISLYARRGMVDAYYQVLLVDFNRPAKLWQNNVEWALRVLHLGMNTVYKAH